jgi:hypothetical protein
MIVTDSGIVIFLNLELANTEAESVVIALGLSNTI